jgi:hypothetical protein
MDTSDSKDSEVIELFIDYCEKFGWPDGLNASKVRNRARIQKIFHQDLINSTLLKIERHRSALGTIYVPGARMSCYHQYSMCFQFEPEIKKFTQLDDQFERFVIDDLYGLSRDYLSDYFFMLSVSSCDCDSGNFTITECVSNQQLVIASEEAAVEFALGFEDAMSDFFRDSLVDIEVLDEDEINDHTGKFIEFLRKGLADSARTAWKERE